MFSTFNIKWLFLSGSFRKNWRQLSRRSQRDHRSGRDHRGRRLHQEVYHPQGRSHQVPLVARELHRRVEVSNRTLGETIFNVFCKGWHDHGFVSTTILCLNVDFGNGCLFLAVYISCPVTIMDFMHKHYFSPKCIVLITAWSWTISNHNLCVIKSILNYLRVIMVYK